MVLAITGGIACGKSEVGRILGELGFLVCDADRVAHALMAMGTPVYERVVEFFGDTILKQDGEISRRELGQRVFNYPDQLRQLNRMVHPAVRASLAEWIRVRRMHGEPAAVQIPLMFESGMETLDWDAIICVSSSASSMIERLEGRGIPRSEAIKRIGSQMDLAEKERLSDRVIHNFGTLQELEKATRDAVESLMLER